MMYMPDALNAVVQLMEADPSRLKHRNSFNIAAMSFEPGQIAAEIRKHLPDFKMDYQIDPVNKLLPIAGLTVWTILVPGKNGAGSRNTTFRI